MPTLTRVAVAIVVGAAAMSLPSCAAPTPPRAWIEQLAVSNTETVAPFGGAGAVLAAFEPSTARDAPWRRGDEVLFGLELERGDRVERRLLLLHVQDAPAAGPANDATGHVEVRVDVFDERGRALASSAMEVAEAFLRRGLCAACRMAVDGVAGADETTLRGAYLALLAFLQTLRQVPSVEQLLWQVVDKPSLVSVLLHGVTLSLHARFDRTTRAVPPLLAGHAPDACYRLPIELAINDEPALFVSLVVAEPVPPLRLAAGVVALDAMHPTAPDRRLRLRLLGARHGDGKAGPFDDR